MLLVVIMTLLQSYIDTASIEATKSSMEHRHGCVVVYKGKVVVSTHNYRVYFFSHGFSIHAEIEALRRLKKIKIDPRECIMIVVRLSYENSHETGLKFSKPCSKCQPELEKAGFKRIYYST